MKALNYILVDVFTNQKFGGNPLAVFEETGPLDPGLMQKIANELNLSETVFVFPPTKPGNTKRIRIFTPRMELPVAGHPTVGTAFLLGHENWTVTREGVNEWILEEEVGDIQVYVHKEQGKMTRAGMKQPIPAFGDVFSDREKAAWLLSLSPGDLHADLPVQTVSSGVPFLYIPVRSLEAMKKIKFRNDVWKQWFADRPETQHIYAFTLETVNPDFHVHGRMFAPAMGIMEDPATGNANGPLGAYLIQHSLVPAKETGLYEIRSEQGIEMGRPSFIDIRIRKKGDAFEEVRLGGACVKVGEGRIFV
ncbi:PhzF family phenazine biosynthesis protein [Thermoactinomyces sp. CICC 10522]|uniref:PhzF family phenazine biosynthesis protein n=1 Tax=Thermoactinomyces sp. CICC 10522 TaxID=2767427 RepID=UPI0018DE7317|nr:PhzF family phenazine biosynthesis protein [Thermoactinomyces sp. CICC 10522]MBH8605333.1 PhzF family phenazine biosynthesis protein [Thermoactinomyces sp. CICC 10522]